MVVRLHNDIFCYVIRFLESDRRTLLKCSRVNKEFNFLVSRILYRKIVNNTDTFIVSTSS